MSTRCKWEDSGLFNLAHVSPLAVHGSPFFKIVDKILQNPENLINSKSIYNNKSWPISCWPIGYSWTGSSTLSIRIWLQRKGARHDTARESDLMSKKKDVTPNIPITEWYEIERNMEIIARMSTEPTCKVLTSGVHQKRESL